MGSPRIPRRANRAAPPIDQPAIECAREDLTPEFAARTPSDHRYGIDRASRVEQDSLGIGKREGDALENGASQAGAIGFMIHPDEYAGGIRIVVRGSFARQIRKKEQTITGSIAVFDFVEQ